LQQELGVLLDAVVVHAAAGVAAVLVAQVQLVVLGHETQPRHARLQCLMARPGAALAAVGLETSGQHAQRHTGLAAVAMGPVGEQAAAPEALADQLGVGGIVDQVAGRCHLGACLPVAKIAAGYGAVA
jgi:hypothetical protein